MSKARLVSALVAGLCILAAAAWVVTGAFPLAAAPQVVTDGPGVSVDVGGAALLHRNPVNYPAGARAQGVSGMVVVQVSLDSTGSVNDMHVVSGPDELRRAALESIVQWHFTRDSAGKTRQVSVNFQAPPATQVVEGVLGEVPAQPRTVRNITVAGVPDAVRNDLMAAVPVHAGDSMPLSEVSRKVTTAVKQFDEHLAVATIPSTTDDGVDIRISAPGSSPGVVGGVPGGATRGVLGGILSSRPDAEASVIPPPPPPQTNPDGTQVQRIRVGGNVQAAKMVQQAAPVYPPLAAQARISGVVKLNVVISTTGAVKEISVVSGHPLLVQSALDAVRLWVYMPTLLNGVPVEVATQVDVPFGPEQ